MTSPHPNIHIFQKGIAGTDKPERRVFTLSTLIKENGHSGKLIDVLKVTSN